VAITDYIGERFAPPDGLSDSNNIDGDILMNWDRIEGNWKQMKGAVKEKWGKLTDDHFDQIGGKRDKLVGSIQEAYGCSRDEADAQVKNWETNYRDPDATRH
jgi:uncharacterized protein YjbJ (UPF0337 family)